MQEKKSPLRLRVASFFSSLHTVRAIILSLSLHPVAPSPRRRPPPELAQGAGSGARILALCRMNRATLVSLLFLGER